MLVTLIARATKHRIHSCDHENTYPFAHFTSDNMGINIKTSSPLA